MASIKILICYLLELVMVLVSVAFVTLFEQKFLGAAQIRVGPNTVGYWGLLQPFGDAVKLFVKEVYSLRVSNYSVYMVSPVFSLGLALTLWLSVPIFTGGLEFAYGVLFFVGISGLAVYPILSSGWSSNCKYSILGSLRGVAQMVSYEASLAVIMVGVSWSAGGFSFISIMDSGAGCWNFFLMVPLGLIWFVSSLAETSRTPYDFSEGESELVSGFNTEYSSGGFVLIFMAEYASILFMGVLFSLFFLSGATGILSIFFKGVVVSGIFVWVRGSLPRFRYDKLMGLAWKSFLPVSLMYMFWVLYMGLLLWL